MCMAIEAICISTNECVSFKVRREYINGKNLAAGMKMKFTMLIAIIMVLSGCTGGVEDAAEEIADVLTKGCMDKTAMNYDATAGESGNCVSESVMTANLIDFLTIVEEGPGDIGGKFLANESLAATMTIDETFEGETVNMVSSFIVDGVNHGFSTSTSITDSSGTWTMNMHHVGEDLVIKLNDTSVRMKTVTTPHEFYLMDKGDNDGDGDDTGDGGEIEWESFNYCQWEGEGEQATSPTRWDCTENANGDDGFDDWWYYCEMHDDSPGGSIYHCTDDFGQNSDYEFFASNDHYVTGGSPDGSDSGDGGVGGVDGPMMDMPEELDNPMDNMEANNTTWSGMDGMTVSGTDSMGGVISATLDASGAITSMSYSISEADTSSSDTTALNTASASMTLLSDTTITIDQSIELHSLPLLALSMDDMMGMFGPGDGGPDDGGPDDGGPDDGGPDDAPPAPEWHCSDEVGGQINMSINWTMVNDGTEDCGDGSDEPHDFDSDGTIDNWWYCADGTNITADKINDGTEDCAYGSDEGEMNGPQMNGSEMISIIDMNLDSFDDLTLAYNLTIHSTNLSEGQNYTYHYEVWYMGDKITGAPTISGLISGNNTSENSQELSISTSEWGENIWTDNSCYRVHVALSNENGMTIGAYDDINIAIGDADCSEGPGDGVEGNGGSGMMAEGTYMIFSFVGYEGALADYEAVLSQCTDGDDSERVCVDTNISMVLSAAPSPDSPIIFIDHDNSSTINVEDMIMVNASLVTEDYNTVRLKYIPADKYSDENPLTLPGFTAGFSLMAMLGAALLLRRD